MRIQGHMAQSVVASTEKRRQWPQLSRDERALMGINVPAFVLAAIHRAAGRQLLEACKALPIVHSPSVRCPTGEAKITEYGHHSPTWQQAPCVLRYSRACILISYIVMPIGHSTPMLMVIAM